MAGYVAAYHSFSEETKVNPRLPENGNVAGSRVCQSRSDGMSGVEAGPACVFPYNTTRCATSRQQPRMSARFLPVAMTWARRLVQSETEHQFEVALIPSSLRNKSWHNPSVTAPSTLISCTSASGTRGTIQN